MMEEGVYSSLPTGPVHRFMPPLVISREEIDRVVDALESALSEER